MMYIITTFAAFAIILHQMKLNKKRSSRATLHARLDIRQIKYVSNNFMCFIRSSSFDLNQYLGIFEQYYDSEIDLAHLRRIHFYEVSSNKMQLISVVRLNLPLLKAQHTNIPTKSQTNTLLYLNGIQRYTGNRLTKRKFEKANS